MIVQDLPDIKEGLLSGKIYINDLQILTGKMMNRWSVEGFQKMIGECTSGAKITSISISNLSCSTKIANDLLALIARQPFSETGLK